MGYIMMAIALVALLGRLFIRWKYARLDWDDLFNCLASMCLIGFTAIPDPTDDTISVYWAAQLATITLLWTTLWLVKAAFIALYWSIFNVSPSFRKAWLAVTSYTYLACFPVILGTFWQCGSPRNCVDTIACNAYAVSDASIIHFWIVITMNAVLHISTELLILALPLLYIRKLQMSKTEKWRAGAVFLVAVITIIVGIVRNVVNICAADAAICDYTVYTLQLTISLEASLAVLVCALPPYKILLAKFEKRKEVLEALPHQNPSEEPSQKKPTRAVAVQDSITELEMP